MKRATNIAEVGQSCDPQPLRREELAQFFIDTAHARDPVSSRRDELRRRLERDPEGNAKLLLSGHGGCGKSTELVKLSDETSDRFFPVHFSVAQECTLFHVPVEDLLVVLMERLLSSCNAAGLGAALAASNRTLEAINQWFAKELDISESTSESGGGAEAGLDTTGGLLGKTIGLFVKLKSFIRLADKRVHRMTYERPHRLGELTNHCNLLIRAVKLALEETKRRLLIVIEDLDKANLTDARRIFLEQPAVLASLNCAVICTIPIFLLHSPDKSALDQHFSIVELPMLKVVNFDGSPCNEGRETIRKIIHARVAPELIEDQAMTLLLEKTGGVLRDVFEVLVVAAGAAESLAGIQRQNPVLTAANIRYGLNRRKTEYARAITTLDLPEDWKLTTGDLYAKLRSLRGKPVRVLPSEPTTMVLLKARAIIEYNDEGWFALHPLVAELLDAAPIE